MYNDEFLTQQLSLSVHVSYRLYSQYFSFIVSGIVISWGLDAGREGANVNG